MTAKKEQKPLIEDLGVVLKKDLQAINEDYEKCSLSMLHYTECTLNDTLDAFKLNKRIDKIQILQHIIATFMDKLLVEKQILNMEVLRNECKLDPTLAPKLEGVMGKKIFPSDGTDTTIKFNRG